MTLTEVCKCFAEVERLTHPFIAIRFLDHYAEISVNIDDVPMGHIIDDNVWEEVVEGAKNYIITKYIQEKYEISVYHTDLIEINLREEW